MEKRLCIVGAGISGLVACKHALEKGFHPVVFEADSGIGGVWAHTLWSTRLQSTSKTFRFSDFPWPASVTDTHPDHSQVMQYMWAYARHFDLVKCIRFNTKVVSIEFVGVDEEEIMQWKLWSGNGEAFGEGRGKWRVTVQRNDQQEAEIYTVDFVVLCIGRFSGIPRIPNFPSDAGPEVFNGKTMHSTDFFNLDRAKAAELIRGKGAIVVGSGKSALDITAECAKINGEKWPCTMMYRSRRWLLHSVNPWGIDMGYFCQNRFRQLLVHKPGEGFLPSLLPTLLSPLHWAISKALDAYYRLKLPLKKHGMLPGYSSYDAISTCSFSIAPDEFFERVEEKSIVLKEMESFHFDHSGVILDDAVDAIEADLVIFATGFEGDCKLRDIFTSQLFQNIVFGASSTTVPLYRQCIHPRIPQLAVIGYGDSLSTLFTSEMMSKWLVCLLEGAFRLPSIRHMEEDILKWVECTKLYKHKPLRWTCIQAVNIWYNDLLCQDMACRPQRKKSFLAEWFQPYGPADYADLCKAELSKPDC